MDCVGLLCQKLHRVAVIDNGIGQVQRLNYLCGIQMKIEAGRSLDATVCMNCVGWLCHMPPGSWMMGCSSLLLSPVQRHGVSGSHPGHSPDPKITDHLITLQSWFPVNINAVIHQEIFDEYLVPGPSHTMPVSGTRIAVSQPILIIRNYWTAISRGIPVVQSLLILTTT